MSEPQAKVRRRVRLIKPTLQLKLCVVFLCVAVACILVQFTLWSGTLAEMSARDPKSVSFLGQALWRHLGITVALLVPLTLSVGILVTHKIAGPVYRFEQHLAALVDGEDPGHCKIRDGDELQSLCDLVNQVADRMRDMTGGNSPERQVMMHGSGEEVASSEESSSSSEEESSSEQSELKEEV